MSALDLDLLRRHVDALDPEPTDDADEFWRRRTAHENARVELVAAAPDMVEELENLRAVADAFETLDTQTKADALAKLLDRDPTVEALIAKLPPTPPPADGWQGRVLLAVDMRNALEAVLLYHSPPPWDEAKHARWKALTGVEDCTSKTLCNAVRKALGR